MLVKKITYNVVIVIFGLIIILLVAKYPTGPNTLAFTKPGHLTVVILLLLFASVPLFIFPFVRPSYISFVYTIYKILLAVCFASMIPIGLFIGPKMILLSIVAISGVVITIVSIIHADFS